VVSKSITRKDGLVGNMRGRGWLEVRHFEVMADTDAERAVALERLSEAQDEALSLQLQLDALNAVLVVAEQAGDGRAMARCYAHEAELLHRRAEVADHISAIAAVLWTPNELQGNPGAMLLVLH
jgi:hypothetical protein